MKNVHEIKEALFNDILKRFWSKVNKTEKCWLWTACVHGNGYGGFTILRKETPPHRFSWIIHRGDIPRGYWVLHKCDVRLCVNPDHLFIGDVRDNTQDMVIKLRQAKGENQGLSKLTTDQVIEMRKLYVPRKTSLRFLANKFNVSPSQVCAIVHRKVWKHL